MQDDQNGAVEKHPVVEYEPEKPAKRRRRSSKKQKQVLNAELDLEPQVEEESEIDRKRRENLATEVVSKFEEGINFCSEIQLNKMFRIWEAHVLEGHNDAITSAGIVKAVDNEDTKDTDLVVATGSKDKTVKLWKVYAEPHAENLKIAPFKTLRGNTASVQSVAAQPTADMVF